MIGKTLTHYEIQEKIGAGGMGEVYRAADTRLGRDVALKVLPPDVASDPSRRKRFQNEARTVAKLNHPSIVTIFSVEEDEGVHFITMELIEGKPLDEIVPARGVDQDRFFEIVLPLADALAAAHDSGVVHRDLKPSNVMMTDDSRVKILDFGLATFIDLPATDQGDDASAMTKVFTEEGAIVGSMPYMSPEQFEGKPTDARSDLFSLGIMLYEMACGQRPFHGDSGPALMSSILKDIPPPITHLNPQLPGELGQIIARCLEKDPGQRFASVRELRAALQSFRASYGEVDATTPATTPSSHAAKIPSDPGVGPIRFTHDLFISYAQLDNEAQLAGQEGWVSAFHRSLEVRVGQLLGKKPTIARNLKPHGDELEESQIQKIPNSALLISVLSPRYIKSEWCTRELEEFMSAASRTGGPKWGAKYRMFKVVKTPVQPHPVQIQPLMPYEFYKTDPNTGRSRELDQIFGPEAQRDYWARLDDLAHDIVEVLERAERGGEYSEASVSSLSSTTTAGVKGSIYVAATSYDLKEEHDAVRRDLQRHGYRILPEEPLPLVGPELEAFVGEQLQGCVMSIHLVGRNYGVVPEGATSSILELQTGLALQRAAQGELHQLIWIPAGMEVADDRQRQVVQRLRTNPNLPANADLIETPLEDLKTVVHQVLNPPERTSQPKVENPINGDDDVTRVYLICDQRDADATAPLADFLYDNGLDVTMPVFEGDEAEVREDHEDNLRLCDGVLVYYGAGNELWLRRKLREVQKSAGLGRTKAIAAKGIWVAPPENSQKSRLRTRDAMVMTGSAEFAPDTLQPFIDALKGAA